MALSSMPNLSLLLSNLNSLVTVKLDSSNYLIWKSQVQNLFRATEFFGYLDGSVVCPSSTTMNAQNISVSNLEFSKWKLVDAHLLSCLTATLSPPVFSFVLHLQSSHEVWLALE